MCKKVWNAVFKVKVAVTVVGSFFIFNALSSAKNLRIRVYFKLNLMYYINKNIVNLC